jgi:NAD(P)-dependent dehydrogenase (short-subunit alcohol dehydrogenase family)
MDLELAGKSVVVTGGASNIGRAIVPQFAEEGANITIADIDQETAEGVAGLARVQGAFGDTFLRQGNADRQQLRTGEVCPCGRCHVTSRIGSTDRPSAQRKCHRTATKPRRRIDKRRRNPSPHDGLHDTKETPSFFHNHRHSSLVVPPLISEQEKD